MVAVDTNVVVRLLTADDPKQAAAACAVFSTEPVWIAKTVLLETCWVLRSAYGFEAAAIHEAFRKLLGLRNVEAEDAAGVRMALNLVSQGLDFADALHLSSRPEGARFVSFDRTLIQRGQKAGQASLTDLTRR